MKSTANTKQTKRKAPAHTQRRESVLRSPEPSVLNPASAERLHPQHKLSTPRHTPPPRPKDDLMVTGDTWTSETRPAASGLLVILELDHCAWPVPPSLDVYSVMADYIGHGQVMFTHTHPHTNSYSAVKCRETTVGLGSAFFFPDAEFNLLDLVDWQRRFLITSRLVNPQEVKLCSLLTYTRD